MLMRNALVFMLLVLCPYTVKAGMFYSDVTTTRVEPACLTITSGGVTGPGNGVTIANKCPHPVIIDGLYSVGLFSQKPITETDVYIANDAATPLEKRYDFSDAGLGRDYAMFRMSTSGTACDHDTIGTNNGQTTAKCASVTLAPDETFLFFTGFTKFKVTGTPNLLVLGKETEK